MVFDTDKFISSIQNNPSIWEVGSKDYMDRNIKEKSWNTIGEYFFENWTEKSTTEKQNTEQLAILMNLGKITMEKKLKKRLTSLWVQMKMKEMRTHMLQNLKKIKLELQSQN